eukprot:gene42494-51913_t
MEPFARSSHVTTRPAALSEPRRICLQIVVGARNSFAVAAFDFQTLTLSLYALCLASMSTATSSAAAVSDESSAGRQFAIQHLDGPSTGEDMVFLALTGEEVHGFRQSLPFPLDLTRSYDAAVLLAAAEHISHAQVLGSLSTGLLLGLASKNRLQAAGSADSSVLVQRRGCGPVLVMLRGLLGGEGQGGMVSLSSPASTGRGGSVRSLARVFAYLEASLEAALPRSVPRSGRLRILGMHFPSPSPSPRLDALSSRYAMLCCAAPSAQPALLALFDLHVRAAIRLSL